jgi:hypothetical protein
VHIAQELAALAKYLAQQCFRNTILEDLHAGITPDSQIGDYTDVVVRSPNGEIPWPNLSRLNDEEMKALMIDVVNKTYHALIVLFDYRLGGELIKIFSSARSSASLERAKLDHDGLRPTDFSARIGATDGNHARCSPTREEPFRENC